MAEKEAREVGIIGQTYEDRKSKRRGVLESREEKYKTLMMRDVEGNSFNITYSTFRSNWRKYQGEEVIQTSTQIEEAKAEAKENLDKAKSDVEKSAKKSKEKVKLTTEEKIKAVRAADELILRKIENAGYNLKTSKTAKGCIIVRRTKKTIFELWVIHNLHLYSLRMKEDFDAYLTDADTTREVIEKDKRNNIRRRFDMDKADAVLDVVLAAANKYADDINTNTENEENEEE